MAPCIETFAAFVRLRGGSDIWSPGGSVYRSLRRLGAATGKVKYLELRWLCVSRPLPPLCERGEAQISGAQVALCIEAFAA